MSFSQPVRFQFLWLHFSSIPGFPTQGGITGRGNSVVCRHRSREIHILLIKIEHLKAALFARAKEN